MCERKSDDPQPAWVEAVEVGEDGLRQIVGGPAFSEAADADQDDGTVVAPQSFAAPEI